MARKRFTVKITQAAEDDLDEIWNYLVRNASRAVAESFLESLLEKAATLRQFPQRGSIPEELAAWGMSEFRQILWRNYRLIYQIEGSTVFVTVITDGRRDVRALLERRLLNR